MGKRSTTSTKSGKFMNPTDQARKEARKRELKKNKRQRQMVRTAVLKGKNPREIILDLEKIDDMEQIKSSQKQGTNMFGSGKYADCIRPFVGLLLSAFGACVMAIAAVMVKQLKSTSVFVILIIRFTVMILMAIPILYFR